MPNPTDNPTDTPPTFRHAGTRRPPELIRHWAWAYGKARKLGCSSPSAAWRATRFAVLGDSGRFFSLRGWARLRK
ncbi:MAG TPA: hypothetical protein VER09_11020 [Pseudomonas sp.]|nr:hypothetical protein [Pseudomonas sp.]